MHHLLILLLIKNHSFVDSSQGHDVETSFGQDTEIFLARDQEPFDLTLPKLETLMSEKSDLIIGFIVDIHNSYIVSVDVNGLVSDNQLFVVLSVVFVTVSQHI